MALYWIGIIIFICGLIVRYIYKFRYYNDYKDKARTTVQKQEIREKYRPMIFAGVVIEVIGCVVLLLAISL